MVRGGNIASKFVRFPQTKRELLKALGQVPDFRVGSVCAHLHTERFTRPLTQTPRCVHSQSVHAKAHARAHVHACICEHACVTYRKSSTRTGAYRGETRDERQRFSRGGDGAQDGLAPTPRRTATACSRDGRGR